MKIFWENVQRYPRFLISSVWGLIIVLVGNILKQTRKNKFFNQPIFAISFLIIILVGIIILFMAILNL